MFFTHCVPTNIRFGNDIIKKDKELFNAFKHAFIVTGAASGRLSGALEDVIDALKSLSIKFDIFEGIGNNPNIMQCYEIGAQARSIGADLIIGIGGGSPLDAAKAIAVYARNDIAPTDIFKCDFANGILPIIAVPTTSGTGSEVTPWSILTVDEWQTKRSFGCSSSFPTIAFLDPKYTFNMPLDITRNTAMDAMTHGFESLISIKASPITDATNAYALNLFSSCMEPLAQGDVEPIREKLMLISMLTGTTIANTGTTLMHAMGYPLTYFLQVPHGRANVTVMPAYLNLLKKKNCVKLQSALDALKLTFNELTNYLAMNFPVEFNRNDADIELWTTQTLSASSVRNTGIDVTQDDILNAYASLWGN
ncbi:MAG: iron-containing alcohol dehydrogenase [Clostridia bacterium]|nr:iron-containing alcohol dehydrogenase [Clostridia bacterium]